MTVQVVVASIVMIARVVMMTVRLVAVLTDDRRVASVVP
jgi:hypothetical protein